jgi:hypothetical protein
MPIELAQFLGLVDRAPLTDRAPVLPSSSTGTTAGKILADLFRRAR